MSERSLIEEEKSNKQVEWTLHHGKTEVWPFILLLRKVPVHSSAYFCKIRGQDSGKHYSDCEDEPLDTS